MSKTTQQFIEQALIVHQGKYDYSLVNYKNVRSKITIICSMHGQFDMRPGDHLHGKQGCRSCANIAKRSNITKFIERARSRHGDQYDYSLVNYQHNKTPVIIVCRTHGQFVQKPNDHLSGTACPACAVNAMHTKETFIAKAIKVHGERYEYQDVIYRGVAHKVVITCSRHGQYVQTPTAHVDQAQGCPRCRASNHSREALQWLEYRSVVDCVKIQHAMNGGEFIIPNTSYRADGFCAETNTIYEFWGDFWHGNPAVYEPNMINKVTNKSFGELYNATLDKKQTILNLGYRLVDIWESEWYTFLRKGC